MLIEEYKPTEEQLNSIEDRLKYLSDSTERLNKVDWQGVAISTIMSISMFSMYSEANKFIRMKEQFLIASSNMLNYAKSLTMADVEPFYEKEILCFNYHNGEFAFSTDVYQNGFFNTFDLQKALILCALIKCSKLNI